MAIENYRKELNFSTLNLQYRFLTIYIYVYISREKKDWFQDIYQSSIPVPSFVEQFVRISLPNLEKKEKKKNCSRKTDTHTWAQAIATTLCLEIMCPSFEHGMTLIHGRSITHLSNNNRLFIVLENITEINSHGHPKL
jgi:hypothetical protein